MVLPPPTLAELGWTAFFNNQVSENEHERCIPVRVMSVHRGKIAVVGEGLERLVSPYMPGADGSEYHPTAGDWLLLNRESLEPERILDRVNLMKRLATGTARKLQLLAANVDTLFIVASCNQDFNLARLERYLVLAREFEVSPIIVLTKADLVEDPQELAEAARGLQSGLHVEMVNGRDPADAIKLAAWCGMGKTVALLGSSGVGKSTLVNTLTGSQNIETQAVREIDGRGRHTTTVREMHRLARGGWLMDTPGMRELKISDAADGLAEVFDDMVSIGHNCRFSDCSHTVEPACAIKAAISAGELSQQRLDRWRKLTVEDSVNTASMRR